MTDKNLNKTAQVLMIGCGAMGGALLSQWVDVKGFQFTVVDPSSPKLPDGVKGYTSSASLPMGSFDLLIIAIKPQMIDDVMPLYQKALKSSGCVISIAAGFTCLRLANLLGTDKIIRIMPNLPASIGMGVAGLYADKGASPQHKQSTEALMHATGTAIWVSTEDELDRLTAISGSGPGYIFEIARVYMLAAQSLGFSEYEARQMVLGTICGTSMLAIINPDTPIATLRNNVTSKKGTTEAGLTTLNGDGMLTERFESAVKAAYKRAVELR